jgi:hypothetical protein
MRKIPQLKHSSSSRTESKNPPGAVMAGGFFRSRGQWSYLNSLRREVSLIGNAVEDIGVTPVPVDLLIQSLVSGFAVIATTAGIVFILLIVVIGLIGIYIHSRIPAYIGAVLTVAMFLLNLHFIAIFPLDNMSRLLISMTIQVNSPISSRLYGVIGKVFYNFGFLLIPFIISVVAMELVRRPPKKRTDDPFSNWPEQ